tara:strand:+ start:62 stop:1108 length:1047 start_codon:yes stop_codon:yes gene_type:complete
MNKEEYYKELAKNPKALKARIFEVCRSIIVFDEQSGQVRSDGLDPDHVQDLAVKIEKNGQTIPITVEPEFHGKRARTDGSGRTAAMDKIYDFDPNKPETYYKMKCVEQVFLNNADRIIYQVNANQEEEPQKSNTVRDLINAAVRLIKNESYLGPHHDLTEEDIKQRVLIDAFNLDKTHADSKLDNMASKIMNGLITGAKKYKNYRIDGVKKIVSKEHKLPDTYVPANKAQESHNNTIFCFAKSIGQIKTDNFRAAIEAKEKNPKCKVIITAWNSNTTGAKSATPIKTFREDAKSACEKKNGYNNVLKVPIFDEIHFLGQVLIGTEEEPAESVNNIVKKVVLLTEEQGG